MSEMQKNWGSPYSFRREGVVDHAKLQNVVAVVVHSLLEKNESLSTTGRKTL